MSTLAEFHFLRPLWLLLLLAIPLFWLLRRHARADAGAWRAAVDPHLLPYLIERIDGGAGRTGVLLAVALWAIACAALAGPAWEREPMPLYRNQAARVLALELSPTMMAQDAKPSRLERARFKLEDILDRSRDYQTALIGYAGDAFVAAPLTDDTGTVRNLIDALDPSTMPVGGNHAARAIEAAVNLVRQAGLHGGEIILLADDADDAAVSAARAAHADGMTVSVLGIGTAAGAPVPLARGDFLKDDSGHVVVARLDEPALRAVADAGGGRYATLTADSSDVDSLLVDRTDTTTGRDSATKTDDLAMSARWRDRGPWLLLLLVPLAALAFRRGWLMALALALLLPAPRADAASFKDLWLRSDQQAAAALASGDAKQAARVARTPDWRATAAYRNGDFKGAAQDYAKVGNADGAYNEGNAFAKQGRYEDAIAAYDRALKLAPDMDDAKANRKAVEDWLKRQQKSGSKGDSKDNKQPSGNSKDNQSSSNGQSGDQKDKKSQDQSGESGQDQQQQNGESNPQKGESSQQNGDEGKQDQGDQKQPSSSGQSQNAEQPNESGVASDKPNGEQQKSLSQAIDRSLASAKAKADKNATPVGEPDEDDASREKRQALEHLLQRVPDDPGGLLRRKFLLEYQRRQQQGDDGG